MKKDPAVAVVLPDLTKVKFRNRIIPRRISESDHSVVDIRWNLWNILRLPFPQQLFAFFQSNLAVNQE